MVFHYLTDILMNVEIGGYFHLFFFILITLVDAKAWLISKWMKIVCSGGKYD